MSSKKSAGQIPQIYLGKPEIEYDFLQEFSSRLFYAVYLAGRLCLDLLCVYLIKRLKPFITCSFTLVSLNLQAVTAFS